MEEIIGRVAQRDLPLHAKAVTAAIKCEVLAKMDSTGRWREASRWLSDVEKYTELLKRTSVHAMRPCRASNLTHADLQILIDLERYEEVPEQIVRCWSTAFTRTELEKLRRRHLLEPFLNDLLTRGDFAEIELPTLKSIRRGIQKYCIQFDFASWYDQFALEGDVPLFFGIKHRKKAYKFKTLPMGFRPSCLIAQVAAEILAQTGIDIWSAIYIDNVMFSSDDRSLVIQAAKIFVQRCAEAGVVINDAHIPPEDRVETNFEFLGVRYDTESGTVTNSNKTFTKLAAVKSQLSEKTTHTFTQIAAYFGLLFWANWITPAHPERAYNALRYFRSATAAPYDWKAPAPNMSPVAIAEMFQWIEDLINAPPAKLLPEEIDYEATMHVDASAFGWGAVVVDSTGQVHNLGAPWSEEDRRTWNLQSSVSAEPLALVKAVQAWASTNTRHIRVFTDHQPLVWAWRTGYAKAYSYNAAILTLNATFPLLKITMEFIAGVLNVDADRISRGGVTGGANKDYGVYGIQATPGLSVTALTESPFHKNPLPGPSNVVDVYSSK
jgi:hypothetical protein